MTDQPRKVLEVPRRRAMVIGWLAEHKTHGEIVKLLAEKRISVTRQAVTSFAKRHASEVSAIGAAVVEAVAADTLILKSERLQELIWQYQELKAIATARGFLVREPKWIARYIGTPTEPTDNEGNAIPSKLDHNDMYLRKTGDDLVFVERFDAPLAAAMRSTLRAIAEEMGELPKAGVYIDARKQTINLAAIDAILSAGE